MDVPFPLSFGKLQRICSCHSIPRDRSATEGNHGRARPIHNHCGDQPSPSETHGDECGRDGIYEAIREGRLEARKFGRRTLITDEALERFLNSLPPLQLPPPV
jgi:excisionase family DNA binding protein